MATNEYHSFSGVDIHAVFDNNVFGELQMVSYKVDREKAPVYTMGSSDMRTIARGKRLISGACVFVVFDRDSLIESMQGSDKSQVYLSAAETANYDKQGRLNSAGRSAIASGGTARESITAEQAQSGKITTQGTARLADQLLPFDITLVGANEYGKSTKMTIVGVELMSEAGGVSIDDLVIEKQMSFIARSITNWQPIA